MSGDCFETCQGHPAAEPTDGLREALHAELVSLWPFYLRELDQVADALLAGPLAPLLAKLQAVKVLVETAPVMRFDNDYPVKAVPVAELLDLVGRRALGGEA